MLLQKYSNRLLLVMAALGGATAGKVTTRFSKVGGSVVEKECLVSTAVPALPGRSACGSACQQSANCRFFCISKGNGTCALFKAYVAVRWSGHPASASTTTYDACYTSWGDPRDIVKTNSPFTYSTILVAGSQSYATDGYACTKPLYFSTYQRNNSFSQIDLEQTTRVRRVTVATADQFFIANMDVFLSNTSDFNIGQKIGRLNGAPNGWSTYTIYTNTSVAGRYITLYQEENRYHGYAEIQVIPPP